MQPGPRSAAGIDIAGRIGMKHLKIPHSVLSGVLILVTVCTANSQITQYTITTKADPHTDFSKLTTYSWEAGWIASDRETHEHVVAAINRELVSLGLREGVSGKSDVTVSYYSLRRNDMNLDSNASTPKHPRPIFPVGTLIVVIRETGTRRELFRARADAPIDLDSAQLNAIIDEKVAGMFALYPTRRPSKRRSHACRRRIAKHQ
jgi:hypothetical protein